MNLGSNTALSFTLDHQSTATLNLCPVVWTPSRHNYYCLGPIWGLVCSSFLELASYLTREQCVLDKESLECTGWLMPSKHNLSPQAWRLHPGKRRRWTWEYPCPITLQQCRHHRGQSLWQGDGCQPSTPGPLRFQGQTDIPARDA